MLQGAIQNLVTASSDNELESQIQEYGKCIAESEQHLEMLAQYNKSSMKQTRALASIAHTVSQQKEFCAYQYGELKRFFSFSDDLAQHISDSHREDPSITHLLEEFLLQTLFPNGQRRAALIPLPERSLPLSQGKYEIKLMPDLASQKEGGKDHTWVGGKMTWYLPRKKISDYLSFLETHNGRDLAEVIGFDRAVNTRQPSRQKNKGSLEFEEFAVAIERQAPGFFGFSPAPLHYQMKYEMHEVPGAPQKTLLIIGYFDGRLAGDRVTQFAASCEILQETPEGGLISSSLNLYQGQRYKIAFIDLTSKVFDEARYVQAADRLLHLFSSSNN